MKGHALVVSAVLLFVVSGCSSSDKTVSSSIQTVPKSSARSSPVEPKMYEVYGTLFYPDGKPAPDVDIDVFDSNTSGGKHALTDSKGNYRISVLGIHTSFNAGIADSVLRYEFSIPKGSPAKLRKDLWFGRGILVSGVVSDKASGEPMAGVEVSVQGGTGKLTVTKVNGGFKAYVLPRSEMSVEVRSPGYVVQKMDLTALDTTTGLRIKLFQGGSVSGKVVDQKGKPVAGIYVGIDNVIGSNTQTDETGHYKIVDVDPYKLLQMHVYNPTMSVDERKKFKFRRGSRDVIADFKVSVRGEEVKENIGEVTAGRINPAADSNNNPTEKPAKVNIAGSVVDALTGKPISNFKVKWAVLRSANYAGNENVIVDDPNGRFDVSIDSNSLVEPDRVTVRVMAGGYIGEERTIRITGESTVHSANVFKLEKAISTVGLITDIIGKGIPGAKVVVLEDNDYHYSFGPTWMSWRADIQIFTTSSDGSFKIDPVVMRKGTMVVKKPGYPKVVRSSVDLTQPVTIILPESSNLTVKAPTLVNKNFWINLTYRVDGTIEFKQIPPDGKVIFKDLRSGKYSLTASNNQGNVYYSANLVLEAGQDKTVKLENKHKVRARIRFTRNGKPVPNVSVEIHNKDGLIGTSSKTGTQGECYVDLEKPGRTILSYFRWRVGGGVIDGAMIPVQLKPGNNTVDIKYPTGRISGRLIDAKTLKPLKGVIIDTFTKRKPPINYLYDEPYRDDGFCFWMSEAHTSSEDGAFCIDNLPSGKLILTCMSSSYHSTYIGSRIRLIEKKPVRGLVLKIPEPGKLHISLVDSVSGKPLRAMPVVLFTPERDRVYPDEKYDKPTSVPAGKLILWVRPDDGRHLQVKTQVEVIPGETTDVTIKLTPASQRIVFAVTKGGRFEELAWPDKPATAFHGPADAPAVNDNYTGVRPWIGFVIKDAETRKPVLTGPNGPEWGGYLPGFYTDRKAALPIKPGNYIMRAVMRNTANRSVLSGDNLWKIHTKFTVVAGRDTVITVK